MTRKVCGAEVQDTGEECQRPPRHADGRCGLHSAYANAGDEEVSFELEKIKKAKESPSWFVENILHTDKEVFPYQRDFLESDTRKKIFVAGRQVGKTTTLCWLAIHRFATRPKHNILIFAPSKRQSKELFDVKLKSEISGWLERPDNYGIAHVTKEDMVGTNGSRIKSMPAAMGSGAGETIRTFTADTIIVDEAAWIQDEFYTSVLAPMLLTTQGEFILAGTPWSKYGYFYDKFHSQRWDSFQVSTPESPLVTAEDIEEFRDDMSRIEFAREILGQFKQPENTAFEEEDIRKCIYRGDEPGDVYPPFSGGYCWLGVDPARYGEDRAVFLSLDDEGNVFDVIQRKRTSLPAIERKVRDLNDDMAYSKILIDETGLGGGPVDSLKEDLRNCDGVKLSLQKKMEIMQTLRKAIEKEEVTIPDDRRFISQLIDMEREETAAGRIKYHAPDGGHDDLVDALALAVWAKQGGKTVERASKLYSMTNEDSSRGNKKRGYTFGS